MWWAQPASRVTRPAVWRGDPGPVFFLQASYPRFMFFAWVFRGGGSRWSAFTERGFSGGAGPGGARPRSTRSQLPSPRRRRIPSSTFDVARHRRGTAHEKCRRFLGGEQAKIRRSPLTSCREYLSRAAAEFLLRPSSSRARDFEIFLGGHTESLRIFLGGDNLACKESTNSFDELFVFTKKFRESLVRHGRFGCPGLPRALLWHAIVAPRSRAAHGSGV